MSISKATVHAPALDPALGVIMLVASSLAFLGIKYDCAQYMNRRRRFALVLHRIPS
jgi:hypothetical protein